MLHLLKVLRLVCGYFGNEMVQWNELLVSCLELLLEKIELRGQKVLKVGRGVEEAEVATEARKLERQQRNAKGQGERSSLLLNSSVANFIEVLERTEMASVLHLKEISRPELCYGAAILESSSIKINSDGTLLNQFLRCGNISFPEHVILRERWQNLLEI